MPERKLVSATAEDSGKQLVGVETPENPGVIYKVFNPTLPGVTNLVPEEQRVKSISDVGREVLKGTRPFIDATATGLGMAGATAAGVTNPWLIPLAGILSGVGTDIAMQPALGNKEPDLFEAGKINAENEFGNFALGGLIRKLGLMNRPYESISPEAQRLGPVYQEMIDKGGGPSFSQQNEGLVTKGAEDIFGGIAKKKQLENAASAGTKVGVDLINKVSGRKISVLDDPFEVAQRFGGDLEATKNAYLKASDQAAETAKHIAALNPSKVLVGYKTTPAGAGFTGAPAIKTPVYKEANGPVVLGDAYQIAQKFLDDQKRNYGVDSTADLIKVVEDAKKPLVVTAEQIAQYKNNTPIPFEAAWEIKKAAGEHGGFGEIAKSYKQGQFASLSDAVDSDIERSIGTWNPANRKIALDAYQEAKTLVNNRHELYQQGDAISRILQSTDSAKPEFDSILKDPLLVGKAIHAAGPNGRSNLQSYQLQKILQDNFDASTGTYNRKGLIDTWKDPNKQAVFDKLYNASQRADIDNFIEALGNVSQTQGKLGTYATAMKVGSSGVNIAGAILAERLTASHFTTPGIIVGGAVATSEVVKRLLLDPKRARALTILMTSSPASQEARFLGRQVIGALNGVRIALQTKDGKMIPATIEDGQITPDQSRKE